MKVDAEKFVSEWMNEVNANGNIESLAERLNMKPLSVYQRSRKIAEVLEEQGVTLPTLKMSSARKGSVDVSRLVAIVQG